MFVTVFLAILNINTGELRFTNAGHNPPLLKNAAGEVSVINQLHGPIAGAVEELAYSEDRLMLGQGDLLLAFTDGVTEAMNTENELYSDARLESWFGDSAKDSAQDWVSSLIESVSKFADGAEQSDDITILALRYETEPVEKQRDVFAITIQNDLKQIDTVVAGLEQFAEGKTIQPGVLQKLCIAFDELLNNIISLLQFIKFIWINCKF